MIIVIILPKFYTISKCYAKVTSGIYFRHISYKSQKYLIRQRYNHSERIINAKSDLTKYRGLSVQ